MGQLITATAAAAWYFSRDKSTVSSRTIAFAFHHATKFYKTTPQSVYFYFLSICSLNVCFARESLEIQDVI